MQIVLLVVALLGLLVLCATSSSRAQENPAAPPLPPELKRLDAWVGTWEAEVSMMGETSEGTETCRLDCGGYWLVTEHTGSFLGQPFLGKGLTGFDATKGAYSGVWIDSSGGPMSVYSNGQFAKDGRSFTAQVEGLAMDGKPARFEYLWTFADAKHRAFEIFQVDGGKRELQMRIAYTRRG